MDSFPFQTVIKTSEHELLQYGIIDWSHVALLAQRNVIWKCRAVTVRVHQEFVFDGCVALEGSEQQSNYSQQSIRLPPWQLWQWLHFFATSSHGTVLKQRPTMTFYEFTCCLHKNTIAQHNNSTLLRHTSILPVNSWNTCTAGGLDMMQYQMDLIAACPLKGKQSSWITFKDRRCFVKLPEQPCEVWPGLSKSIYSP